MARGNHRQDIVFFDDGDRKLFARTLAEGYQRAG